MTAARPDGAPLESSRRDVRRSGTRARQFTVATLHTTHARVGSLRAAWGTLDALTSARNAREGAFVSLAIMSPGWTSSAESSPDASTAMREVERIAAAPGSGAEPAIGLRSWYRRPEPDSGVSTAPRAGSGSDSESGSGSRIRLVDGVFVCRACARAMIEGTAREPARDRAGESGTDGDEGVDEVALRPRPRSRGRYRAVGPRGRNAGCVPKR